MTFGKTNVLVLLLAGCFCIPASGQSSSWSGTWTLDSDSQIAKPAISFIANSDGTYELVSSTVISRFRCDGKAYHRLSRTGQLGIGDAICTSLSSTSLDISFQEKDKQPTVGHLQVSGDGRGLIFTIQTSDSSGSKQVKVRHYARLSGSNELAGDWKNVDPNPSQVLKVTLSQQAIILEYPLSHQTSALPLSGAEIHPIVNGAPARGTQAVQLADTRSFRLSNRQGGVVLGRAIFLLSLDGNMITERFWLEKHPEEVARYTYRRSR